MKPSPPRSSSGRATARRPIHEPARCDRALQGYRRHAPARPIRRFADGACPAPGGGSHPYHPRRARGHRGRARAGVLNRRSYEVAAADDRYTIADLWSDLYETWTRTFVSPWKLGDPSERKAAELSAPAPSAAGFIAWQEAWDYWVDAWQRTVLFWDVLRQRSEQYSAEKTKPAPHVLSFDAGTGPGRADVRAAGQ
jgi:hypothetical protein